MKSLLIALLLGSSSAFALSSDPHEQDAYASMEEYVSWCYQNNVVQQAQNGQLAVQTNCSESGLTCELNSVYRVHKLIYFATCEAK